MAPMMVLRLLHRWFPWSLLVLVKVNHSHLVTTAGGEAQRQGCGLVLGLQAVQTTIHQSYATIKALRDVRHPGSPFGLNLSSTASFGIGVGGPQLLVFLKGEWLHLFGL